jgi:hypothetical protein
MKLDLFSNIKLVRAISPVSESGTTAVVSQIIDMAGFKSCVFGILTGSLADANATFTTLLEESDDSGLSGSNEVADDDMIGTEALASFDYGDDNKTFKLGYKGSKRYVRLTITPAGNSDVALVAAVAILAPEVLPNSTQEV